VSVHPEPGPRGAIVYRVRWREGGRGSPARCRTFDHEDDAREFDRRVRRLKQTGDPALFADEVTLGEYVHGEWWPNYAERRLALSTQQSHSIDLDLRILPCLGDLPLARVRPSVVERFAADLERAGVGRATIVSTLAVLQGVMKRAVRDYNLPGNPVKAIDKPSQRRDREPVLVTVAQVEAMRVWCLERDDLRSAALISLLAYAGPRPNPKRCPCRGPPSVGARSCSVQQSAVSRTSARHGCLSHSRRTSSSGAHSAAALRKAPQSSPTVEARSGPNTTGTTGAVGRSGPQPRRPGCARARTMARGAFARVTCAQASRPSASTRANLRSTSPTNWATAPARCSGTTRASGRTSIRRSASAPRRRSSAFVPACGVPRRRAPQPRSSGLAVLVGASVFHRCFMTPRSRPLAMAKALEIPQALCRTRTDDPFLTMEVLYQLS
jgi:hypothetical protein